MTSDASDSASTRDCRSYKVRMRITAMVLSCASISFFFFLGYPWDHHNESLVWEIGLSNISFWEVLTSNPVHVVANFRPLALAVAWITLHISAGGIWLQQLINFIVTISAWAIACASCRNQMGFAWLSLVCNAIYFSGYIYLFHLHGVFYPPLFVLISILIKSQNDSPFLTWRNMLGGGIATVLAAMFHPFALLIFAFYILGLWLECRIDHRTASVKVAVFLIGVSALLAALSLGSQSKLRGNPLQGILTSYQMLEINNIVTLISVLLAALAGLSISARRPLRLAAATLAGGLAIGFTFVGVSAILGWVVACTLIAIQQRRIALAGVILACAILPAATGTGSPTYAIFVLMPCIAVMAYGLQTPAEWMPMQRRLGAGVILFILALLSLLRLGVDVPFMGKIIRPLQAEQQKTEQLAEIFDWLDRNLNVSGRAQLCEAALPPTKGKTALSRTHRAPTDGDTFDEYVKFRYGSRLTSGPNLYVCFGGQNIAGTTIIYSSGSRIAGTASVQTVAMQKIDHSGLLHG